jgi:putative phosphoesterase
MPAETKTITLGVLADTHIPDRLRDLPPGLLEALQDAHVDRIIHAGDACSHKVIRVLEKIAPVTNVQGNRDWLFGMSAPQQAECVINNNRIAIAHGHHSILDYSIHFLWGIIFGKFNLERYYRLLIQDFPDADLIIFGHTHYQKAIWVGSQLLFNPGAAYPCEQNHFHPQFGIISITPDGVIRTEFHSLA